MAINGTPTSELPTFQRKGSLLVPVVDMTMPAGQRNGKIALSAIGSGTGEAAGFFVESALNKEVDAAPGSTATFVIYTPTDATKNALIHNVQIKQGTLGGGQYHYELFVGDPASNGRLIYSSANDLGRVITRADYRSTYPLLVLADEGSNVVYMRVHQRASYAMLLNVRTTVTEFDGLLEELPGYTAPPPYTGALKMAVYVGPEGEFEEPRYAIPALHPNGTMFVQEGTYFRPFGMGRPGSALGVVNPNAPNAGMFEGAKIKGEGAYRTIFNGRGGIGAGEGFGLFYGKGVGYFQFPIVCEDVGFIGGGGADLVSDGEAGTYLEGFAQPATAIFRRCSWDQNENGVFVPDGAVGSPGAGVTVRFEECDFGLRRSNGQSGDGKDHNFYISGEGLEVIGCHGYGTLPSETYGGYDSGNTYKARAKKVLIDGGYCESGGGRWLDRPKGGETTMQNVTLSQRPTANGNVLAYANEQDPSETPAQGAFDTYIKNCDIYISRFASTVWNNKPGTTIRFEDCSVTFCQWDGNPTPPSLDIQGPGAVVGLSDSNNPPAAGPYPLPVARPGSIAQPGYVPSWP